MPVIEFTTTRESTGYIGALLEDGDGLIRTTHQIELNDIECVGDICDVYHCDYEGTPAVVKLARSKLDNDLVKNEAAVLRQLIPDGVAKERWQLYLPRLINTHEHDDRALNILERCDGWYSLAQVLEAFPDGLDFRDAVWMYRRLLEGLSYVHEGKEILHGAIIPEHVLIHPPDHAGKIIDWSYARALDGGRITAMVAPREDYYPEEVLRRKSATAATDLFMATKVMVALVGGDPSNNTMPDQVPGRLQNLLRKALSRESRHRPETVRGFYKELDELLQEIVGKKKFRPFQMP